MSNTTPPHPAPLRKKSRWGEYLTIAILLALIIPCCLSPIAPSLKRAEESSAMQQARAISLMMSAYASDNQGAYPEGKTSTEVFQKLLDGKYATDPGIFCIRAFHNKTSPSGERLTADNICFDITSGTTANSSDDVPVVFSTGYAVTYSSGASAIPKSGAQSPFAGIAVAYKNCSARFINAAPDGSIPNFVPATFNDTKTYRQLTP